MPKVITTEVRISPGSLSASVMRNVYAHATVGITIVLPWKFVLRNLSICLSASRMWWSARSFQRLSRGGVFHRIWFDLRLN